jgi:plastocyanin
MNFMKLFLLSLFFTLSAQTVFAKEVEVQMKSISFSPKIVQISAGDSIVWKNVAYTEHSASGEHFDTGLVKPKDKSKAIVFSTPGTYAYNCKIHGKTMSGTIQVSAK